MWVGSNDKIYFASMKNSVKHQNHPLILCFYAHSRRLTHQLLFHVCLTCGSWMLCLSACSSKKSNMYLIASGRALPRWAVLNMVSNRSSTNFCSVPWRRDNQKQISLSLNNTQKLTNGLCCMCLSTMGSHALVRSAPQLWKSPPPWNINSLPLFMSHLKPQHFTTAFSVFLFCLIFILLHCPILFCSFVYFVIVLFYSFCVCMGLPVFCLCKATFGIEKGPFK